MRLLQESHNPQQKSTISVDTEVTGHHISIA
jgi:hypothetical protein